MDGNVGDSMIHTATRELFGAFNISYREISAVELDKRKLSSPVDTIVISGGGNMGSFWPVPFQQRVQALQLSVPLIIFPQSFTRNDETTQCYKKVFVRERASLAYNTNFVLAPDTALGLSIPTQLPDIQFETGLFLREDMESAVNTQPLSLVDPVLISNSIFDYLSLAALFEHIITDRLHFAIAGLMCGRCVTLLPNSYHKNRSMHETWLRDLGCHWMETPKHINYDKQHIEHHLWKQLAGDTSGMFDWTVRPLRRELISAHSSNNQASQLSHYSNYNTLVSRDPNLIYAFYNGENSIEEIVLQLSEHFPHERVAIARDMINKWKDHA